MYSTNAHDGDGLLIYHMEHTISNEQPEKFHVWRIIYASRLSAKP